MVAGLLARAGLLDPTRAYDVTLEDRELLHVLRIQDRRGLTEAIQRRNETAAIWAFKIPNLHGYLAPSDLALFRNPHLIVVMRDMAAIAHRHATAERMDPAHAFLETAQTMTALLVFLITANCPTLIVSYEKAILHPDAIVRAVMGFAHPPLADDLLNQLPDLIQPEDPAYARTAARSFAGNIDGIVSGHLIGWCRDEGDSAPVSVDLLVNGTPICTARADLFRGDLRQAGIGDGHHGFDIDTARLSLAPGAILAVRVSGRTFQIPGSGQPTWRYMR